MRSSPALVRALFPLVVIALLAACGGDGGGDEGGGGGGGDDTVAGVDGTGGGGGVCSDDCATAGARRCAVDGVEICGNYDDDACLEWGAGPACAKEDPCVDGYCQAGCQSDCERAGDRQCDGNAAQTCGNHDDDPCLEWGADEDCGADTCAAGYCVSGCTNDCATPSERRCDENTAQVCGDYDDDPCLEWGEDEDCGDGVCRHGFCGVDCDDDCTVEGARRCAEDGFQICGNYDDDVCLEWGVTTNCPEGQTCSNGYCRSSCVDECTVVNARRCDSPDAYAVCGNYDPDGCLEWGTPTSCATGETCSNGFCSSTCTSECTVLGAKRCDGDAVQTCGDTNSDGCLEWGTPAPCGETESCSNGFCAATCSSECTVSGAARCSGDAVQTCGDTDQDGCLEWGTAVPCGASETCSNGFCAATCTSECNVFGAVRCSGNAVETCGDPDEDGCLSWGTPVPCESGETCSDGHCSSTCTSECTVVGARQCQGDAVQTCGDTDDDPCLEWGTPEACGTNQTCSNGYCALDCENECTLEGAQQCASTGSYQTCSDHDADGCLEWGTPVGCDAGETCSGGACVSGCVSECTYVGARQCDDAGTGYQLCGDANEDGCLEWGSSNACPAGTSCSAGVCSLGCVDECTVQNGRRCGGPVSYEVCDDHDDDGCLEWGSAVPCPGAEVCSDGNCALGCADECGSVGARRCDATGSAYQLCDDYDDDGCLEWGSEVACEGDLVCSAGYCSASCTAECEVPGATRCNVSGTGVETCGDHNDDGCLEWGTAVPCEETETCADGACATVSVPGEILISEVLYDGEGTDVDVFVELYGDPGLDLSGFVLVGVNGSNNQTYQPIPLVGSIPGDGFFVIAHTGAAAAIAAEADVLDDDVDYQNGPDSVQLRWGATIVDAVGYGDFTDAFFAGEGTPAPDVSEGRSLARDGAMTDTDDNLTDFAPAATPTPGTWNGAPNERPTAVLGCPAGGNLDQNLTFDASGSSDSDGTIASYRFDFGDGTVSTGPTDSAVHAYGTADSYTVTLTVTDNQGATGSDTCTLTVSDQSAPTVLLLEPLEDIQVTQGSVVDVVAFASPGPQRTIDRVELVVDGAVVGGPDTVAPYEFTYTVPAEAVTGSTVLVQARATDDQGVTGTSAARQLFVRNDPPVASFTAVITGALSVRLDATAVSDTETATGDLEIRWDFDADGTFDTGWTTEKTTTHVYDTDGEHTIAMEVRDAVGQVTSATRTVNFQLVQYLYGEVTSTTWYGEINITGDAWVPSGETLVIAAGTTVVFWQVDAEPNNGVGDIDLVVNGTLTVEGTAEEPVIFTTRAEEGSDPAPQAWNKVHLASGSSGHSISHAIFEYADVGLHAQAGVDVDNTEFRFNRIGAYFNGPSGAVANLTDVTVHDSASDGVLVTTATVNGVGFTSRDNGGRGVALEGASFGSWEDCTVTGNGGHGFDLRRSSPDITLCTITGNGETGVRYAGQSTGTLTYSQVKNNENEGVRVVPEDNTSGTPTVAWNNIFGNGAAGSMVTASPNLSISGGSATSNTWSTPNGEPIAFVETRYDEYEYYNGDCRGYVQSSNGTQLVYFSSDSSRRWHSLSTTATSARLQSQVSYYRSSVSMNLYRVGYVATDQARQLTVVAAGGGTVMARHNYFGVWPDVLQAVSYSEAAALDIEGFVPAAFDASFDRGASRGGDTIEADTTWDTAMFPDGVVYLSGAITVASGATLTVAPGMSLQFVPTDKDANSVGDHTFDAGAGAIVLGEANGATVTVGVFTGGGALTLPTGGGYWAFEVSGGGSLTAYDTVFESGHHGLDVTSGTVSLDDVTVRGCASNGVQASGSVALTAAVLLVEDNGQSGVRVTTSGATSISGLTSRNNPQWGIVYDDAHATSNALTDSYLRCNGQGGLLVESSYLDAHHNNVMNNGDTVTGACTLAESADHKGFGVWLRGDATGSITDNNIEVNRWEGIFGTYSDQGNPTAVTITGNNVAQNGLSMVGVTGNPSISISGGSSTSSTWSPGGPVIEFVKCAYDEYEYYTGDCRGYLKKQGGAGLVDWTSDRSSRWYDITASDATGVYIQSSVSYYRSSVTASCNLALYRAAPDGSVVEATFVIGSGAVEVTGNYWGGRTAAQVVVAPQTGTWTSSGFEAVRIPGTGPRL